nr:MAG TPA: hypothetical protein [Caudoviricetes sp.]
MRIATRFFIATHGKIICKLCKFSGRYMRYTNRVSCY